MGKSTPIVSSARYDAVAKSLHWLTAAMVIGLLGVGLWMTGLRTSIVQDRCLRLAQVVWSDGAGADCAAGGMARDPSAAGASGRLAPATPDRPQRARGDVRVVIGDADDRLAAKLRRRVSAELVWAVPGAAADRARPRGAGRDRGCVRGRALAVAPVSSRCCTPAL